jgi:hypothetical protein
MELREELEKYRDIFSEDKKPLLEGQGKCQKCGSDKILTFSGKCSDLCYTSFKGIELDGYVPAGIGIDQNDGYGDYVQGDLCLACGQMQGRFPISDKALAAVFGKNVVFKSVGNDVARKPAIKGSLHNIELGDEQKYPRR